MSLQTRGLQVLGLVCCGLIIWLLFRAGQGLAYADQLVYLDSLRSVSAIIFGVTGAWLAISYPKAMAAAKMANSGGLEGRSKAIQAAQDDTAVLIGFVRTMMIAMVILALTLLVPYGRELLRLYPWSLLQVSYLRGSLFVILGVCAMLQLGLLLGVLRHTLGALTELHRDNAEATTKSQRDDNQHY